jgi:hypothetical protein
MRRRRVHVSHDANGEAVDANRFSASRDDGRSAIAEKRYCLSVESKRWHDHMIAR